MSRRCCDDSDADRLRLRDVRQIVDVPDPHTTDDGANFRRVDIDDSGDIEAATTETAVVRKGLTKISGADDDDWPRLVQTKFALNLVREVLDVVTDSACSVTAQVRQVFAHLRCIDAGQLGQLIARHLQSSLGRELYEDAQIHGQARDSGFRNSTTGEVAHAVHTLLLRATFHELSRLRPSVSPVTLNTALAAAAALVALAFGLNTADRWARRRRRHDLAWTIAMGLFAVAAMSLWWAEARGWSSASFRMFFAFGAVINVPWLALGTIYLLAGTRIGDAIARVLLVFSGFALGVVMVTPMSPVTSDELPKGSDVFTVLPRVLAAVGSAVPAIIIFAGAAYSAVQVLRRRSPSVTPSARRVVSAPGRLALGNILIALGAIILSASGSLAGRLGEDTAFATTLFVGICVLFAGFLVASGSTVAARQTRTNVRELIDDASLQRVA